MLPASSCDRHGAEWYPVAAKVTGPEGQREQQGVNDRRVRPSEETRHQARGHLNGGRQGECPLSLGSGERLVFRQQQVTDVVLKLGLGELAHVRVEILGQQFLRVRQLAGRLLVGAVEGDDTLQVGPFLRVLRHAAVVLRDGRVGQPVGQVSEPLLDRSRGRFLL